MRKKRSLEEIKKSSFCNFSELCLLLDVPRITLTKLQKETTLFPYSEKQGSKAIVKMYPVFACQKIYDLVKKKTDDGYKTIKAVEHVINSKPYERIIKRHGSG